MLHLRVKSILHNNTIFWIIEKRSCIFFWRNILPTNLLKDNHSVLLHRRVIHGRAEDKFYGYTDKARALMDATSILLQYKQNKQFKSEMVNL